MHSIYDYRTHYWDLSNEHMTFGSREFYYDKKKVVS